MEPLVQGADCYLKSVSLCACCQDRWKCVQYAFHDWHINICEIIDSFLDAAVTLRFRFLLVVIETVLLLTILEQIF